MACNIFFFFVVMACLAPAAARYFVYRAEVTPDKCCLPKQYSTFLTPLESLHVKDFTVFRMQEDFDRKQQTLVSTVGGSPSPMNILNDYKTNTTYIWSSEHPENCTKTKLYVPMYECIPEDAEYLGESYMGAEGPGGSGELVYDGWRFESSDPKIVITMSVTKKNCVPLVEAVTFPDNPSANQLYSFAGFKPKLTNPEDFNLPESCKK